MKTEIMTAVKEALDSVVTDMIAQSFERRFVLVSTLLQHHVERIRLAEAGSTLYLKDSKALDKGFIASFPQTTHESLMAEINALLVDAENLGASHHHMRQCLIDYIGLLNNVYTVDRACASFEPEA